MDAKFIPTPYFNTPKFRDWRKSETNSKKKDLSSLFPVSVNRGDANGLEIQFQDEYGRRITFYLPELETNLLRLQIDKSLGKQTTREDYDIEELERRRFENKKCKHNHRVL